MEILTAQERRVLSLLAEGKSQVEIADMLCLSVRTIYAHTENARRKTKTPSTVALAVKFSQG